VHPTITQQIAREAQRDRLARAERARLVREARAELKAWYLRGLRPKLEQAASAEVVTPQALEALDADVRGLLDLTQEREEAA
jgi:hypothetical protein